MKTLQILVATVALTIATTAQAQPKPTTERQEGCGMIALVAGTMLADRIHGVPISQALSYVQNDYGRLLVARAYTHGMTKTEQQQNGGKTAVDNFKQIIYRECLQGYW